MTTVLLSSAFWITNSFFWLFLFIYLFISIFIQVKIRFNKCTISNTVTNTVINAFPVVKYDVLGKKKKKKMFGIFKAFS